MTTKMRDFRTTGVVLRVGEEWFKSPGVKQQLADALRSLIFREYSIAPQDVDVVATNIALVQGGQRLAVTDAIVVFDATYGSLRLTEPVFTDLSDLLDRFARAADLVGEQRRPPSPMRSSIACALGCERYLPCPYPTNTRPKFLRTAGCASSSPGAGSHAGIARICSPTSRSSSPFS